MSRPACLLYISSFLVLSSLAACGPGNENAALGAGVGAAVGAGGGAIIGNQAGSSTNGALIGGAAGAVVGAAVGSARDEAEKKTTEEDRFIERQKLEAERQRREVEDLRRQQFHDDYYRSRYGQDGAEAPAQPDSEGFGGY